MTDLFAEIVKADRKLGESAPLEWGDPLKDHEWKAPAERPVLPHESRARARAFAATNVNILALDLGTSTGWALATRDGHKSGSLRLDPKKLGGNGRRWIAFREWLTATARQAGGVQAVYFEDVRRHIGTTAAHVYGGYLAMLEAWCATNNVPLHGVGVGTIKKAWTGNGRAEKADMIAEAKRRGVRVSDDNEADAVAILAWAINEEN